jgi:enoyl-CoA hydratase/carnithine racemase
MYDPPVTITLTREHDGRVARVHFDNAERGNCFSTATLDGLVDLLETAAADDDCAVVRLEMAGRHFCTGWDTTSFADLRDATHESVAADLRHSDEAVARIRRLPVPVVAAVRGRVIGFGAGLLAAVHLPVAADDVLLSLPEARFGFAPAGVGHTIGRALPRPLALDLLLGATTATAATLHTWGMVARVVPAADVDAEVDRLVAAVLAVPNPTVRAVVEVAGSDTRDLAYDISARTIVSRGV